MGAAFQCAIRAAWLSTASTASLPPLARPAVITMWCPVGVCDPHAWCAQVVMHPERDPGVLKTEGRGGVAGTVAGAITDMMRKVGLSKA